MSRPVTSCHAFPTNLHARGGPRSAVSGPRVLLMQLSQRTSAKGNAYLSGWLGKASVVAFRGEDDRHGNPTWDVFVSTPEPRADDRKSERPASGVPADRTGVSY